MRNTVYQSGCDYWHGHRTDSYWSFNEIYIELWKRGFAIRSKCGRGVFITPENWNGRVVELYQRYRENGRLEWTIYERMEYAMNTGKSVTDYAFESSRFGYCWQLNEITGDLIVLQEGVK